MDWRLREEKPAGPQGPRRLREERYCTTGGYMAGSSTPGPVSPLRAGGKLDARYEIVSATFPATVVTPSWRRPAPRTKLPWRTSLAAPRTEVSNARRLRFARRVTWFR